MKETTIHKKLRIPFLELITKYSSNENYNIKCWLEIEKNYSSKSRYYHNLEHIENMIIELQSISTKVKNLDAIYFAIFYHDIIYKSTRSDNEYQSAVLFKERISKTSFKYINEVFMQIEETKAHKLSKNNDTNILLDLDLTVLGKSSKDYKIYCKNIRKEYKIYPNFMYKKGRKKALKSILELKSIYKTDFFIHKYEKQARQNLTEELNQLNS